MASTQPECIGILGRAFGHKFVKSNWTNPDGSCFRCGYFPVQR